MTSPMRDKNRWHSRIISFYNGNHLGNGGFKGNNCIVGTFLSLPFNNDPTWGNRFGELGDHMFSAMQPCRLAAIQSYFTTDLWAGAETRRNTYGLSSHTRSIQGFTTLSRTTVYPTAFNQRPYWKTCVDTMCSSLFSIRNTITDAGDLVWQPGGGAS